MESIYNLVPEEYDPVKFGDKGPMYRSRYDPKAGVTGSTFNTHGSTKVLGAGEAVRKASGTMGRRTDAAGPQRLPEGPDEVQEGLVASRRPEVRPADRHAEGARPATS